MPLPEVFKVLLVRLPSALFDLLELLLCLRNFSFDLLSAGLLLAQVLLESIILDL